MRRRGALTCGAFHPLHVTHLARRSQMECTWSRSRFAASVDGWQGAAEPEGDIRHTNSEAYHMAAVEPALSANSGTSIVDANFNASEGILIMDPLASAMTEDHTFDGCFDDCEPW